MDELLAALTEAAVRLTRTDDSPVLAHARQMAEVGEAVTHLEAALRCDFAELRGEELRLALACVGRLRGRVDTESVLDVVFSAFCIGK